MEASDALSPAQRALSSMRFDDARALAEPVFRDARDAGNWALAAEAALVVAKVCGNQRRSDEALRWAHEALLAATHAGRPDVACGAWIEVARERAFQEHGGQAQDAASEVLALVPALTSCAALEAAYTGLSAIYSELGLVSMSLHACRQALAQAELRANVAGLAMTRTNLLLAAGMVCEQLLEPDPEAARQLLQEIQPHLEKLRSEAPQVGTPLALARMHRAIGALHACEQRWADAVAEFEWLTSRAAQWPGGLACTAWIEQGRALQQLGQLDAARACGEAAALIDPTPNPPRTALELRRRSRICQLTGRPEEALELLQRHHDRRLHVVLTAMSSRAQALNARVDEQLLRVENLSLREHNAALQAHVRVASRMAASDPLTGLLNRRGLESAWQQPADSTQRRALALVDLDHFKRINDEHSHTVGDAVLRRVAQLMQQVLRDGDCLARYGGEEFAVLLMVDGSTAARAILERLRQSVRAHDWHTLAPGIVVTVSVGVVEVEPLEPLDHALVRADLVMYEAKRSGRDRVCLG